MHKLVGYIHVNIEIQVDKIKTYLLVGKQIRYNLPMVNAYQPKGVFAATVTPLRPDLSPDLDGLTNLIRFLATRGCHGVLVMGTTGEGPSFSMKERLLVYQTAAKVCREIQNFQLLTGTGTPSLDETIALTKAAFDLGVGGVVVLPPYYFKKATTDGLITWFGHVLNKAVPSDGSLLGYHIPPVTGVSLPMDLLARLRDTYPDKFIGVKDSSGDPEWAQALGSRFGTSLVVLNGNDRLFSLALQSNASGCITAMANLLSPLLRKVWDNFNAGIEDNFTQEKLTRAREVFDKYPPMPPLIKLMLARLHGFPSWTVKPPLMDFDPSLADQVEIELDFLTD
jgi:4-hydroxy-tetrahydrodipicolinate synthase